MELIIQTPKWAVPLIANKRYKGAKGGRGSGKSHFFGELLVEEHIANPDQQTVCIREIQKSLKFSAKKLIEDKIRALGVSHLFDITLSEIRRIGGTGIIIFQGMQDHTADSIKSIEGFDRAWVEEAQSMSARSLELLLPTIRAPKSEIWFSWNPDQEDDPVEKLFADPDEDMTVVHVNFTENPFLPDELRKESDRHLRTNPDTYDHVWEGGYNTKSDKLVFNGKYSVGVIDVSGLDPFYGMDFGFAQDPTTGVECYVLDNTLYVSKDCGKVGLELDDTSDYMKENINRIEKYVVRADSARPESISYLRRHGIPKMEGVKKWPGSVEDGIEFMRSFDEIIINPECTGTLEEFRHYSYKVHKQTRDILPVIEDKWNHYIDAIRYALGPLIQSKPIAMIW